MICKWQLYCKYEQYVSSDTGIWAARGHCITARCISLLPSLQSGGHCLKDNTRPCDQLTSPAFRHLCSSTGKLDQAEKFSIGFPVLIDKFLEMFLKWDEFKMRERNGCLEGVGCSINVTLMLPIYQKRNTGVSGSCCLYLVTRDISFVTQHRDTWMRFEGVTRHVPEV